jgi:hypothetical protein
VLTLNSKKNENEKYKISINCFLKYVVTDYFFCRSDLNDVEPQGLTQQTVAVLCNLELSKAFSWSLWKFI